MDVYFGRERPRPRDWGGRLPVALVFPEGSGLGLSSLGWQVVYRLLMGRDQLAPERFFLDPGRSGPVVSADSGRPLSDFPLVAVSLGFEEDMLTLARAFLAADIPPPAASRPGLPYILAGGPLAFMNPAPVAPLVDLFFVGEAEGGLVPVVEAVREGLLDGLEKPAMLERLAGFAGVYAPGVSRGPVSRVLAPGPGLAEPGYSCFVSPEAEFRDMLLVEVNRGCPYGCRFCAAGFVYRPPRLASEQRLREIVEGALPQGGGKVGLIGTALTDWPRLMDFLKWLKARGTKFSLGSVRADGVTEEFLGFMREAGVRTITLALEAPSRRLRRAANKKLDEADFLRAVELSAEFAVNTLKTYLIIGWPGETDEDYEELRGFLGEIEAARKRGRGAKTGRKGGLELISLSASCLVPKPWTPFQWAPMAGVAALDHRLVQLRDMLKPLKGWAFKPDKPRAARLQAFLARGDESLSEFILEAAAQGVKQTMRAWDGRATTYLERERAEHDPLPWEVIDIGVSRAHLWREWQRYREERVSPKCPAKGCEACGGCG